MPLKLPRIPPPRRSCPPPWCAALGTGSEGRGSGLAVAASPTPRCPSAPPTCWLAGSFGGRGGWLRNCPASLPSGPARPRGRRPGGQVRRVGAAAGVCREFPFQATELAAPNRRPWGQPAGAGCRGRLALGFDAGTHPVPRGVAIRHTAGIDVGSEFARIGYSRAYPSK